MLWAHAARGFDNNLRVRSARRFAARADEAMRIITGLFQREMKRANGSFSPKAAARLPCRAKPAS